MKPYTLFLLSLFLACRIYAQAPIAFERYYDFGYTEEGYCVQQTTDRGYIICGRQGIAVGYQKLLLQKVDSVGNLEWIKLFGSYDEEGYAVKQTFDGGYIVTGRYTNASYIPRIYLLKTDANGDTLWTKKIQTTNSWNGYGSDVIQTADSGYVIIANGGELTDTVGTSLLIKTNSNGDTLWTKKISRFSGITLHSLKQLPNNNFIIAGEVYISQNPVVSGMYLINTDSIGDTLWTKIHTILSNNTGVNAVILSTDNGYLLRGNIYYQFSNSTDIFLIKTDITGDTLWTKAIGGLGNEGGGGAQYTADGGYIISGTTTSYGAGGADVYLVKTDSLGQTLWSKTFGGINNDAGNCVQQTIDHGFVISGITSSFGMQNGDVYLIKTDSLGNAPTGISEHLNPTNNIAVFPNPFVTSATITVSGTNDFSSNTFILYDYSGRELIHEKMSGSSFTLEKNDLAAGIYFCTIQSDNGKIIGKAKIIVCQ